MADIRYCIHCGAENPSANSFCLHCGKPIGEAGDAPAHGAPGGGADPAEYASPYETADGLNQKNAASPYEIAGGAYAARRSGKPIALIVVLIVACAAVAAYFLLNYLFPGVLPWPGSPAPTTASSVEDAEKDDKITPIVAGPKEDKEAAGSGAAIEETPAVEEAPPVDPEPDEPEEEPAREEEPPVTEEAPLSMTLEEVEAEILRIRELWNTGDNRITVASGVDGAPYARTYLYENGQVIFAYLEADDAHRLYFKDGRLFRWRYSKDSDDSGDFVDHDLAFGDPEYDYWQEFVLLDASQAG
jgi:hypothetical protein